MLVQIFLLSMVLVGTDDLITNQEVLDLVARGVPSQLIVAMVENSRCRFDTSTEAILSLRDRGVPDEVLQAMIEAQGPPDESDDGQLMVYVSDSHSWEVGGGFVLGDSSGVGTSAGGARPQTVEIIKTFQRRCPEIAVTSERSKADYVVLLDHEGGKGLIRRDNKVAVFGREGTSIYSNSTRSLGNAVKGACAAIHAAERVGRP